MQNITDLIPRSLEELKDNPIDQIIVNKVLSSVDKFLVSKDLIKPGEFLTNTCKARPNVSPHEFADNFIYLLKYHKGNSLAELISSSFSWGNTKEGSSYWHRIFNTVMLDDISLSDVPVISETTEVKKRIKL